MTAAGLKILVVEDHDYQRGVLAEMFRRLGAAEVALAADGEQALAAIRAAPAPFDVVLTDLDMPSMDGMALIGRLAAAALSPALILASSHGRPLLNAVSAMANAYGLHVAAALPKPVTLEQLSGALQQLPRAAATPQALPPAFGVVEIRRGIALGEFEPWYQPKVALASGRVTGAEALARWRHPAHGMLPPGTFMRALERSGHIDALMWTIVEAAAAACAEWRRAGLDATVSVNLSPLSLGDESLADRLIAVTRSRGLEPGWLTFEITETTTVANLGPLLENLTRLRMRGFGLAIDDYGTGYSSLQMLTRVAFSEMKIDRAFIIEGLRSAAGRTILESSIAMARRLGLVSVAEGVETAEEWALMRELGADQAQGYFIGRAMELGAFRAWCEQRPPLPG